jgi:hypothetical protein
MGRIEMERRKNTRKDKQKEHDHPQRKRKDCLEAAVMSPAGSDLLIRITHNQICKKLQYPALNRFPWPSFPFPFETTSLLFTTH